jgi:hypothetical protein
MSELVADCPRCGAKEITFDLLRENFLYAEYNWKSWFEAFCVCRRCHTSTVFRLTQRINCKIPSEGLVATKESVSRFMSIDGYISIKDALNRKPPQHLPKEIEATFREGATCLTVGCYNAAATMFRLCVDMATKSLLPEKDENGLNNKIRRSLGFRLPWLLDNRYLPDELRGLSTCIKEDGNDGAHEGSLGKADAEDLLDFTEALLERLYTEPERLRLAEERRKERRAGKE